MRCVFCLYFFRKEKEDGSFFSLGAERERRLASFFSFSWLLSKLGGKNPKFHFFFKTLTSNESAQKKNSFKKSTWLVRNKLPVNPPVRVPSLSLSLYRSRLAFLSLSLSALSRCALNPFGRAGLFCWFPRKMDFEKSFFFSKRTKNRAKPREGSDVKELCEREGAVKSVRAIRARSFSRECFVKRDCVRVCAF